MDTWIDGCDCTVSFFLVSFLSLYFVLVVVFCFCMSIIPGMFFYLWYF